MTTATPTRPDQTARETMATATMTMYDPAQLALLPEDEWKSLIDRDLRTLTKPATGPKAVTEDDRELAQALRSPACIDRYFFTLLRMLKNAEGTLASRREEAIEQRNTLLAQGQWQEWRKAEADHARQRRSTLRFKSGLEQTLLEIKFLRSQIMEHRASTRLERVVWMVKNHRENFPEDDDPSQADIELWRLIDDE